jgi:hypothetical protein
MSLHNFNSSNKSWKMYSKIITSINSDDLTITPYDGKDLLLEVSGNNNIIFKKGTNSYILDNLINDGTGGGGTGIINGSDASFSNVDVSVNLNPLILNSGSIGINGKSWGNAYIRDLSITNIDISGNLNPLIPNSGSIGINGKSWGNAYIRDLSITNIDISGNLNPLIPNSGSIGIISKPLNNAYIRDLSISNIDISNNLNPLTLNSGSIGNISKVWNEAHINTLVVYKGLTDTIYKIKYFRWNNTFTVGALGADEAGPYPTGNARIYNKSQNTILEVETSFSYTFPTTVAGSSGSDVVYSFLRLTYGTTTINGNQIQQRWGNNYSVLNNGTGTRSATLPQCNVSLNNSDVSGNITIGLFFSEGVDVPLLNDALTLLPGYFKVTEIWA